ncbi:MAG: hypothetical protein ACKOXF_00260 [Chitinophagaceae bacterium]
MFVLSAQEERLLLSFGVSEWYMKPDPGMVLPGYKTSPPGYYYRIGYEFFISDTRFMHTELLMSFNSASMEGGIVKSSRLCYNYGFGLEFGRFKWSLNPGLCYVSLAYQNNISGETLAETRFAPSLGLQADYAFVKTKRQYMSLFTELSVMAHKPSKWVNQLAAGLSWKPVLSKERKAAVSPL